MVTLLEEDRAFDIWLALRSHAQVIAMQFGIERSVPLAFSMLIQTKVRQYCNLELPKTREDEAERAHQFHVLNLICGSIFTLGIRASDYPEIGSRVYGLAVEAFNLPLGSDTTYTACQVIETDAKNEVLAHLSKSRLATF